MSYIQTKVSMKQIEDKPKEEAKEPSLPVFIPMRIMRWVLYSAFICVLLMPAMWEHDIRISISVSLILGHFASQLNALINKKS